MNSASDPQGPARRALATLIACILTLALAGLAAAQEPPEVEPEEEVYEMPEFRVDASQDTGYRATNAISGTLLNTKLKETPFAIDVFTEELIDDTGATDFRQILAYDSGVQLDNTLQVSFDDGNIETNAVNIQNNDTDVIVRGFRVPTLKNGFNVQTRVDTVNIGRIERAAGPVGLLYGIGAISGITNILTKLPLPEPRYEVRQFFGNKGYFRTEFDFTGPLPSPLGQLAYRLTGAWEDEDDYQLHRQERDHDKTEVRFIAPVLEWRPWENTSVVFEFEYGTRLQSGIGPTDVDDDDRNLLSEGFVLEGRTDFLFFEETLGLGSDVNIGGPDTFNDEEVWTTRLELTQTFFEHFTLFASWLREDYKVDRRDFRESPSLIEASDSPRRPDRNAPPEARDDQNRTLRYAWGETGSTRDHDQVRVSLLYSVELFGEPQNFVIGRQERSQYFVDDFSVGDLRRDDPREFIKPDGRPIRFTDDAFVYPITSTNFQNEWYQGHYAIWQGSMLDGMVRPIVGYRWDRVHTRWLRQLYNQDGEPLGDLEDPVANRGTTVNGYANKGEPFKLEAPTAGITVNFSPQLSGYFTYSEGYSLANTPQRLGDGRAIPPEFIRSRDIGIKFDLFDQKLSGRMTYFIMDKLGGARYAFWAPAPERGNFDPTQPITYEYGADVFDGILEVTGLDLRAEGFLPGDPIPWDLYGEQIYEYHLWAIENSGNPDGIAYAGGNNPTADRGAYVNFDEEAKGVEMRFDITPLPNWQIKLSYTYIDIKFTAGYSGLVRHPINTGMHPVFVELGISNFADPRDPSSYNGSAQVGVTNNDSPEHAATMWTRYDFSEGMFEGLDVAMGVRYKGERLSDSQLSGTFRNAGDDQGLEEDATNLFPSVPEEVKVDLALGYDFTRWDTDWRIQLNVRNLFDETVLESSSLDPDLGDGGALRITREYREGREIRVSLQAEF